VKLVPQELRVRRGTEEWFGHVARPATLITGPQTPQLHEIEPVKRGPGSRSENATLQMGMRRPVSQRDAIRSR